MNAQWTFWCVNVRGVHPSLKGTALFCLSGAATRQMFLIHVLMMSLLCLIIYKTSMCLLHQTQTPQSGSYVPAASLLPAPGWGGGYITLTSLPTQSLMSCSISSLDLCTNSLKCHILFILFFLILWGPTHTTPLRKLVHRSGLFTFSKILC